MLTCGRCRRKIQKGNVGGNIVAVIVMKSQSAKFGIGQVVKHRKYPFRGVIFDIDPEFANTEEWWQSIPADVRPRRDQPFYHLFAENAETEYVAYVSEQNLVLDTSGDPVRHPQIDEVFVRDGDARQVHAGLPRRDRAHGQVRHRTGGQAPPLSVPGRDL